MAAGGLARLIAAVEAAVRAGLKAVAAFAGTLLSKGLARPQAAPTAHFGEQEQLEESKYYPPAPSPGLKLEEGELPDSYGETRVVLLMVDPYLVHAYWEVSPDTLREAKSRIGDSAQAVLRFYEASGSFDVDVDLRARNWYVSLWSADKSYRVDLGLRDGGFVRLARSNVVSTPPALPRVDAGERFMRVGAPGTPAEIIPPPPYRKPRPSRVARFSKPIDSAEILRRKLAEFYALRKWRPEPLKPEETPVGEPGGPWPEEGYSDLTELAEKQQVMGVSSAFLPAHRPEQ